MNNFEKIKQMTVEEMAEFVFYDNNGTEYACGFCPKQDWCNETFGSWGYPSEEVCINGMKQWLLQEVEE